MNPRNPTVPWVAWDENVGGVKQIFVSRLVGGTHFETRQRRRADIEPNGETRRARHHLLGQHAVRVLEGGSRRRGGQGFYGHFVNAANPTFVLDESDVPLTPTAQADVREPISSGCTATPFNADGAACQGGALGTPFFLFTNGTSPLGLFADAYQPETPHHGHASSGTASSAMRERRRQPRRRLRRSLFQFGTTTAYGRRPPRRRHRRTRTRRLRGIADRSAGWDDDPLPRGGDVGLRLVRRQRPDADDRVPEGAADHRRMALHRSAARRYPAPRRLCVSRAPGRPGQPAR